MNLMTTTQTGDEKFMRLAIDEARKALYKGEVPIGAVIVSSGRVIGRGHNLVETLGDPTAHAEMQAITAAADGLGGKYLEDCVLYVTMEPCAMCAGACGWSHMGRVVYGAADPKRGYSVYSADILHPRTKVTGGILEEECGAMVSDFFKKKR